MVKYNAYVFYGIFIPKAQGPEGNGNEPGFPWSAYLDGSEHDGKEQVEENIAIDVTGFPWSAYLDGSEHDGKEQVEESITDIISSVRPPSTSNVTVIDGTDGSYVYITASQQSVSPDANGGIMVGPQLVADPGWAEMLRRFCAEANFSYHSPQWRLVVD